MEASKIAIVIPAYNEELTIATVVSSVKDLAHVIVVSDKSRDNTVKFAESAGAVVVDLKNNVGYEGAIQEGFKKAVSMNLEFVVTMDADGQHTRESVEKIIKELNNKEIELVIGIRPKPARIGEYFFCRYFLFRFNVKDPLCGLKAYKLKFFKDYGHFDTQKLVGSELMMMAVKKGAKFTQVPITIEDRDGESRYGAFFKANMKIFIALGRAIKLDLMR